MVPLGRGAEPLGEHLICRISHEGHVATCYDAACASRRGHGSCCSLAQNTFCCCAHVDQRFRMNDHPSAPRGRASGRRCSPVVCWQRRLTRRVHMHAAAA